MISINTLGLLATILAVTLVTVDADVVPADDAKIPIQSSIACERATLSIECGNGKIDVISANYGRQSKAPCSTGQINNTNCQSSNSSAIVNALCDNKKSCKVPANNAAFGGDPCPKITKYLKVDFRCIEFESKKVVACENKQLNIKCPRGQNIKVSGATYGRTNSETCDNIGPIKTTNCKAQGSSQIVREKCDGKGSCLISAINGLFGDPCPGTVKYLEVEYVCVRLRN